MKIAQIGTGGWGKNHCRVLHELGVLSGICDVDQKRARLYADMYETEPYFSVESLLDSHEFDAAVIATPTSTHYSLASTLINAGKHIFVEKPMTYESKEGQALVDLARKQGVTLTSGYIERFNPAVQQVKQMVSEKTYGDLMMVEFHRENRMPLHIKDVGIIYDTSVHDIDTALWLFDAMPELVFARAGKLRHHHEDFASIMLGFPDNRVAIIASNWITPIRMRTFSAVFTDGRISGDFITKQVTIDTADETIIPRHVGGEPLKLELENFVAAINGQAELIVKPEHGLNVTKIAEAAIESTRTGQPVAIQT